jgi:hypothetical protein
MKLGKKKQTPYRQYDVVVVGGGSAGVAAAVSAGRRGARVALLERYGFAGGMATTAEVGTICGLFHRSVTAPVFVEPGFGEEFVQRLTHYSGVSASQYVDGLWYLPYEPADFKLCCDDFLSESGVDVFYHTAVSGVTAKPHQITSLSGLVWNESSCFHAGAVVDTTGEASIAHLAEADLLEGATRQAGAIVFSLYGVQAEDERALYRELCKATLTGISEGKLSESCKRISIVPGSLQSGRVRVKLSLPDIIEDIDNVMSRTEQRSRQLVYSLVQYWRNYSGEGESFCTLALADVATQIGVRTGRRPMGRKTLTESDVLNCRKHEGVGCKAAWPIEQWGSGNGPDLVLLPENEYYTIPLQTLWSSSHENLFFAGRSISADDRALASARVIGTCFSTGFLAGAAAALYAENPECVEITSALLYEGSTQ